MITPQFFAQGCRLLQAVWQCWLPDSTQWRWEPAEGPFSASLGGGYLALRLFPLQAALQLDQPSSPQTAAVTDSPDQKGSGINDEEEEDGAACLAAAGSDSPPAHFFNFHVVYSPSYGVPVLYFEAQDQGGSPLGLAQVVADLAAAGAYNQTALLAMVSQEEHPCLRRPFFMVHPCQTDEIMRIMMGEGEGEGEGVRQPSGSSTAGIEAPYAKQHRPEEEEEKEQQQGRGGAGAEAGAAALASPLLYMMVWLSVAGKVAGLQLPAAAWREHRRGSGGPG